MEYSPLEYENMLEIWGVQCPSILWCSGVTAVFLLLVGQSHLPIHWSHGESSSPSFVEELIYGFFSFAALLSFQETFGVNYKTTLLSQSQSDWNALIFCI